MSPEGLVLGADSTSSTFISSGPGATGYHYLNHNQKLFELGENATIGMMTWGLAGLPTISYRTLIAQFSDELSSKNPKNVQEIADRWSHHFWNAYQQDPQINALMGVVRTLEQKQPHDPGNPASRTRDEEQQLAGLKNNLFVGFCIAGYWLPDRTPLAYEILFGPDLQASPKPRTILQPGSYAFWGMPNMIKRLMWGADESLRGMILQSGKWNGTPAELDSLFNGFQLGTPILPIRDAIDFVHSCIHSTIKAMKFSSLFQVCGGPIEIAVITTDRRFRWVRHKPWDVAIMEGAQ